MQADDLRTAVTKVVDILERSNIGLVVDQYRAAKGDQRAEANASLRETAGLVMGQIASMNAVERQVTQVLHLDSLGSRDYWVALFDSVRDPKGHQAEIVRLASRIMFAKNHLPSLLGLVSNVSTESSLALQATNPGDDYLFIRLTDAGERASDPDRVARSIDGIDMLYSACASITRKAAVDIRIDSVIPKRNRDRDIVFVGERDSIAAVYSIIYSIPETLSELDPEQEINLDAVVQSLPIFDDLNTLASMGTFSKQDLKDIHDTMHQGALLILESGVIPVDREDMEANADNAAGAAQQAVASSSADVVELSSPVERDEHYDRYLKEREAMLRSLEDDGETEFTTLTHASRQQDSNVPRTRNDAAGDLLKRLGQSRKG